MKDVRWRDHSPLNENFDKYFAAIDLAEAIERAYQKYKVSIKIPKKGYDPICGDGFEFRVWLKDSTRYEDVSRAALSVQNKLKLRNFRLSFSDGIIYLNTSTPSSVPVDNSLDHIMQSKYYIAESIGMEIAHPIGVNANWQVMMCDLVEYPHALVCGTTKSGKSTALKCLLVSLLQYAPDKVNLLVAERGVELHRFKDLPHLSHPVIYNSEILAYVFLLLHDEMERRNELHREDEASFSRLPYIVCVIDEFQWFIKEIEGNKATAKVVPVVNDILRFGRNTKIHLVLAINDPKDEVAIIDRGDLPAKLIFQTTSTRKSMNALDSAGAEKLGGRGDMIFQWRRIHEHLQGVYIDDEEIGARVDKIQCNFRDSQLPRGTYGFTVSETDIEKKRVGNTETILTSPLKDNGRCGEDDKELKFAHTVLWALSQASVSANLIQRECSVGNRYASTFYEWILSYQIIGDIEEKGRRKVLPKSIEDVPEELKERLSRQGITDDMIKKAIEQREST